MKTGQYLNIQIANKISEMPKKIVKIAQKINKQENKPVIILANPQLGYNIGAVARVMANFDLYKLRLVKPLSLIHISEPTRPY